MIVWKNIGERIRIFLQSTHFVHLSTGLSERIQMNWHAAAVQTAGEFLLADRFFNIADYPLLTEFRTIPDSYIAAFKRVAITLIAIIILIYITILATSFIL